MGTVATFCVLYPCLVLIATTFVNVPYCIHSLYFSNYSTITLRYDNPTVLRLLDFKYSSIVRGNVTPQIYLLRSMYVIGRPLVVSSSGEGRWKSVLSCTTGDVDVVCEL